MAGTSPAMTIDIRCRTTRAIYSAAWTCGFFFAQ